MKDAADAKGVPLTKDESREAVYGMPYDEWKAKHQKEASPGAAGDVRKEPQALTLAPARGRNCQAKIAHATVGRARPR